MKWLASQAEARGIDLLAGLSRGRGALRGRSRRRGAHRRQGDRQARQDEGQLRAGRRPPSQGHDPGRGRAGEPHQAAGAPAEARRGEVPAGLLDRGQGAVGGPEGPAAERAPCSTPWASRWTGRRSAAASSTASPRTGSPIGLVVGLDYRDPFLDPHALFQSFKEHPLLRGLLDGGTMLRYGARTISEGGWYSIPRPYADGVLLVGETAGYLNAMRLKGIHLAIKTGMLAAETALEALVAGRHLGGASQGLRGQGRARPTCSESCGRSATSTRASSTASGRGSCTAACRCSPADAASSIP